MNNNNKHDDNKEDIGLAIMLLMLILTAFGLIVFEVIIHLFA